MSLRSLTIFLIFMVILSSAASALYYMGTFDSYIAEFSSTTNETSSSVVRKPVSNIVLPLSSSEEDVVIAEGSNSTSTEVSSGVDAVNDNAGNVPVVAKIAEEDIQVEDVAAVSPAVSGAGSSQVVKVSEVKKVAAIAVTESPEKVVKAKSVIGKVRALSVKCTDEYVTLKLSLSKQADRVTWFNVSSPRKLVIDVRGQWENFAKSIYRLDNCSVEKIVLGEQADRLRLVLYINKSGVAARIAPEIKKTADGVELKIKL
uniref:AMIN domain-containing protein n=1 Tax=Maridesulfovibrio frigidus TaxID=340956 RepID=UPI0004E189DD|nr:AMIN domain-containing protein [Maridesulfovibrio frigidus]